MTAQEIADRLLNHPVGATPERLAKAMALAERSRRGGLFREALQVGLEARGITLEMATIRAAAQIRQRALVDAQVAALTLPTDHPHRAVMVAHFVAAIPAHQAMMAHLEAETPKGVV